MKLTVVGCGDAFGSGGRLQTCYHLDTGGEQLLIDCGTTSIIVRGTPRPITASSAIACDSKTRPFARLLARRRPARLMASRHHGIGDEIGAPQ